MEALGNLINLNDLNLPDCTNLKRLSDAMFKNMVSILTHVDFNGSEKLELSSVSILTHPYVSK